MLLKIWGVDMDVAKIYSDFMYVIRGVVKILAEEQFIVFAGQKLSFLKLVILFGIFAVIIKTLYPRG